MMAVGVRDLKTLAISFGVGAISELAGAYTYQIVKPMIVK
jgi:hypothetical protein